MINQKKKRVETIDSLFFLVMAEILEVLYALLFFRPLRVVPAIRRADEVACDAADALEFRLFDLIVKV